MNYIMTFIFLCLIFFYYQMIGKSVNEFLKINSESLSLNTITGFIIFFFISFIIGIPLQYLHASWNLFFYTLLVIYVLIFIFCFKKTYNNVYAFYGKVKLLNSRNIIAFAKNNWLLVVFVLLFTLVSTANNMSLYQFNYDDYYYVGKIVNSVGTPALLNEDFYNGILLPSGTIDIPRICNTYEITYGFLASLFHINVTFFCKVGMVIHNYIITVIVMKHLAALFIKNKSKAQYIILPFFVLLISHGYLMEHGIDILSHNFKIRSYDLWQFQTAIWYGGSIVRVLSIPILLIYSLPLVKGKINIRNFSFIAIISCVMISFTTGALPIIIFSAIGLLILKFGYNVVRTSKNKDYKKLALYLIAFAFIIGIVLLSKKLDHTFILPEESYKMYLNDLEPFRLHYIGFDFIYSHFLFIIIVTLIIYIKSDLKYMIAFIAILILLVTEGYAGELLCLTSFKYNFVVLRFYSSIQFLLVFLIGLDVVKLASIKTKDLVINILSILLIFSSITYIYLNFEDIKYNNFLGSGINETGYNFANIVNKENLMPDIFNQIGDYFNKLPYGNYTLLAPASFKIGSYYTYQTGFNMVSNRIQIINRAQNSDDSDNYTIINDYLSGKIDLLNAQTALDYFENAYILTLSNAQKTELESLGYEIKLHSDNYYLMHK